MDFFILYKDYLIALTTCLLTLGVTLVSTRISHTNENRVRRRQELIDCYAAFFSAYAQYIGNQTNETKSKVVSSLEVARLLFPKQTASLFQDFEVRFIQCSDDFQSRQKLLDQIRKQAMNDISKF